jgi:hypothetical protein
MALSVTGFFSSLLGGLIAPSFYDGHWNCDFAQRAPEAKVRLL